MKLIYEYTYMNKQTFEQNIQIFLNFYKAKQTQLNELEKGIQQDNQQRTVLDWFLNFLEIPANQESRYAAYMRLAMLKEDPLKLVLEKQGLDENQSADVLYEAFIFVKNFITIYYLITFFSNNICIIPILTPKIRRIFNWPIM